jgi:hypothetical protein
LGPLFGNKPGIADLPRLHCSTATAFGLVHRQEIHALVPL